MKKLIIILTSLVVVSVIAAALIWFFVFRQVPPERERFIHGDFEYTILDDGRIEIYAYRGDDSEVLIPVAIDGRSVASIGEFAFADSEVTKVSVGSLTERIGNYAFSGCYNLKSVTMYDGITRIGDYAFLSCSALETIDIVISVITSFFIRKVEYHETITYFQDTLALKSLQMKNDSLKVQLDIFQKEREERLKREQYVDSICGDIDKKLQYMYDSMLVRCQDLEYRESCYVELAKTVEEVQSLWYSYQDQIYDNGMLSQIKVYYNSVFDKLHRRALSVLDTKPLSPELERLESHTSD